MTQQKTILSPRTFWLSSATDYRKSLLYQPILVPFLLLNAGDAGEVSWYMRVTVRNDVYTFCNFLSSWSLLLSSVVSCCSRASTCPSSLDNFTQRMKEKKYTQMFSKTGVSVSYPNMNIVLPKVNISIFPFKCIFISQFTMQIKLQTGNIEVMFCLIYLEITNLLVGIIKVIFKVLLLIIQLALISTRLLKTERKM